MAVRSYDEIMDLVRARVGESDDENDIAFIEDISDTLKEHDNSEELTKLQNDYADLKKKYRDRFFQKENAEPNPDPEPEPEDDTPKTFDDLFKEV